MRSFLTIFTRYGEIGLAAIAIISPASAQYLLGGNQLWSIAVAEKTTGAGIKIGLEQQLRLHDHSPLFAQTFTELRLGYVLDDNIVINGHYRHILYSHDTAWRVAASATIKSLPGRKSYSLRLKFQRQQRQGGVPANHIRFRGTISLPYPKKTITPFLQGEPWLQLGHQQYWDRYRLTAGVRWEFAKRCSWDLFYRFQGDRQESGWSGINILGLKFKTGL